MIVTILNIPFLSIFDVEALVQYGGLLIVFLAVFAQTGLFFCFFLPSGALMFTSGVFVASGVLNYHIALVCAILIIAAMLGNATGYLFGLKAGPMLYKKKDSRFFKTNYLKKAEAFYAKYGGMAMAGGLFFPIIRTFSPIIAGIIKIDFRRFLLFSFIGSVLWISCFVLAGYFIATMPFIKPYLKYVIVAIILFVTAPIVINIIRTLKK